MPGLYLLASNNGRKKGGVQGAVQCPPLFRVDGSRACRLGVGVGAGCYDGYALASGWGRAL